MLERMAEAGVLLAPGVGFGRMFGNWARLCYSAVPDDLLEEGIDRLNKVLASVEESAHA